MKAVIASPPIKDFYFTPSRASALGAEAVKKILQHYNIETILFNFPVLRKKPASLPLPSEMGYLNEFLMPSEHGPLSFFTRYHRFGPSMEDCSEIIATESPQVVFLTCFAWAYAMETVDLATAIKKRLPGVPIVVGGAGVSVNPSWFEIVTEIDHVITGEAEIALPVFLKNTFKIKTSVPEAQENPGFYWSQTGISTAKNTRYISAILSRGCPKACRFCSNHLVHGRKFRKAAIEDIIIGLNEIPDDYNIHFNFEDDNLLLDKNYFCRVINEIKNRFPKASFSAENGLDYTMLNPDSVTNLINSGFKSFNFSMASSNIQLLLQEKREADLNKLKNVIQAARAAGAVSTTYFICGLEGETVLSTLQNLGVLHSLPTLTGISMFYPVPGLPGFLPQKLANYPPRLCAGSSAYPWTKSLTTKQMITSFRIARLSNLLKTAGGQINSNPDRQCQSPDIKILIKVILKTGKLHTLINHQVVEVETQDLDLVTGFLDSVYDSID